MLPASKVAWANKLKRFERDDYFDEVGYRSTPPTPRAELLFR